MKYVVFSSGSQGNASLLRTNNLNILIDAGITKKQIEEGLAESGLKLEDINYLFITHEHVDHIRAISQLLKYPNIKIVISRGTLDFIIDYSKDHNRAKDLENIFIKTKNGSIMIIEDSLEVEFLPLFHDAREPIGFLFKEDNKKFCYITDTGYVHSDIMPLINNADAYVLESNHDPELLMASDRPYYTKLRIIGDHGHMSNEDSMYILAKSIGDKTKLVMHAHISQECNLVMLINSKREEVFKEYNKDFKNVEFVSLGLFRTKEYEI